MSGTSHQVPSHTQFRQYPPHPTPTGKAVAGRAEFEEKCGGLPAGSVFSEPLPTEDQRREANPPRRADKPKRAPGFRQLDFVTNHQRIYEFVQAHEHTYRLFRSLLSGGGNLFTKNSFRSLIISAGFLYDRDDLDPTSSEDEDSELDEAYRIKIFDDMTSADAFFARVLHDVMTERERHHLEPLSGLNYQQFLRYICVEIGSRIDDRSEFHSIFAFVRRCVGTYDDESGSSSSSGDEGTDSGVRR